MLYGKIYINYYNKIFSLSLTCSRNSVVTSFVYSSNEETLSEQKLYDYTLKANF